MKKDKDEMKKDKNVSLSDKKISTDKNEKKKETFELPSLYQDLYKYFVIIDKFYNFTISKKIGKFTITRLKNLLLSTGTIYSEEKLRQLMTICANIIQLAYITEDTKNNTTELEISFPKCSSTTVKGSDKRKKMVYDCIKEYLKKFNDDINNIPLPELSQLPRRPENIFSNMDPYHYSSTTAYPLDITGVCSPIKDNDNENNKDNQNNNENDENNDNQNTNISDNPIDIINYIKSLPFYSDQIQAMRTYAPKPPQYQEIKEKLSNVLKEVISKNMKIDKLYKHQAAGIDAVKRGQHLSVSTSTASGKSMIYNLSIIDTIVENPVTTALYLFPTKALAQDQLRVIKNICKYIIINNNHTTNIQAQVCDGDTSNQDRKEIKKNGSNILITNPDFLHYTIMPDHKEWIKILKNLKFIVVDECHIYKGVFGINVSFILRRLIRICLMYGSYPQFICCSATIANPREHICKLLPIDCIGGNDKLTVIDSSDDGSPTYERTLVIWNPKLKKASESETSRNISSVLTPLKEICKQVKVNEEDDSQMKENEENSLETFLKGCENNVRTLESLTERATALKSGKRKRETYEKPSTNSKTSSSTTSSCSKKYSGDERTSSIVETSLLFSTLLKKKVRTLGKIKQTFFFDFNRLHCPIIIIYYHYIKIIVIKYYSIIITIISVL